MLRGSNIRTITEILNKKCRNCKYPGSEITRFPVDDNVVSWDHESPEYKPEFYESQVLQGKPWADPKYGSEEFLKIKFNEVDNGVNRVSYMGNYRIVENLPQNPIGRTGIYGRGILGRWGPNHAADPIVTQWKRDDNGDVVKDSSTGRPLLQMCAILRRDCAEWAIPGGMVDPGEKVSVTLKREFTEEALNCGKAPEEVEKFFQQDGEEVYRGYVDDPRNTDNAWMETLAVNFHDDTGDFVGGFKLEAGDDAARVKWADISEKLTLYASHIQMIKEVVDRLQAHW
ncbi:ADP-ribose pyrophosphatase, mitochondrial [Sergentomyia squamirostris]